MKRNTLSQKQTRALQDWVKGNQQRVMETTDEAAAKQAMMILGFPVSACNVARARGLFDMPKRKKPVTTPVQPSLPEHRAAPSLANEGGQLVAMLTTMRLETRDDHAAQEAQLDILEARMGKYNDGLVILVKLLASLMKDLGVPLPPSVQPAAEAPTQAG